MAAQRPENADERLVADALQRAFGGSVPQAAFLEGREVVQAAASQAADEAAADATLVADVLQGAFATPLDPAARDAGAAAVRAAAEAGNVVPLRRLSVAVGRHAVAAVVAIGTLGGGSGVAAASSSALPGEMLYPVKRAVEQVMLTAAFTPGSEARVQADLAARRLHEVERLLASGASAAMVGPLLDEYEQRVALVRGLDDTGAHAEVAALADMAENLYERSTVAMDDPGSTTSSSPTEAATAGTTATEAPATAAPEPTETTKPAPSPEPSTTTKPASESSSGTTSTAGTGTAGTGTTSSPPSSPSPSPSPSASPTPNRQQSEAEGPGNETAPGQNKPKPNKPKPDKPDPEPEPSPTVDPDSEPASDSAPLDDSAPLADWEERTTFH